MRSRLGLTEIYNGVELRPSTKATAPSRPRTIMKDSNVRSPVVPSSLDSGSSNF